MKVLRTRMLLLAATGFGVALVIGYVLLSAPDTPPQANQPKGSPKMLSAKDPGLLGGQWAYLPNATLGDNGLVVRDSGLAIVEQDGSGGQPNPPLNLFGTRLQVSGDFAIEAELADVTGEALLQLYGQPPIIADEFRVEPASIRISCKAQNCTVHIWNGSRQQPESTQTLPINGDVHNIKLRIARRGNTLSVTINDQTASSTTNIFAAGSIWFGMDAKGPDWRLASLRATAEQGGTVQTVDTSALKISPLAGDGLQQLASKKRSGFLVGAAMALGPMVADSEYAKVSLGGNFGSLTTENALKWQFVHPKKDVYTFGDADALVALAARHNMKVHAHTLVFGEANPRWVRDTPRDQREAVMLDHIKTVAGHYKGKVASWDVVNEPFDDEEWSELRPNLWYQAMGESYIAKAFHAARAADPDAQLFMNDYGLEEDGDRWDAMLALVKRLKQAGVPIDGVGFQAHVYESGDRINASVLRKHIQQLAALGVKARISEMDVYSEDGQITQASQYSSVFQACLSEPNCVGWTSWGVTDRYDYFRDDDGSIEQGNDFLWDEYLKPTPAVAAIQKLLR